MCRGAAPEEGTVLFRCSLRGAAGDSLHLRRLGPKRERCTSIPATARERDSLYPNALISHRTRPSQSRGQTFSRRARTAVGDRSWGQSSSPLSAPGERDSLLLAIRSSRRTDFFSRGYSQAQSDQVRGPSSFRVPRSGSPRKGQSFSDAPSDTLLGTVFISAVWTEKGTLHCSSGISLRRGQSSSQRLSRGPVGDSLDLVSLWARKGHCSFWVLYVGRIPAGGRDVDARGWAVGGRRFWRTASTNAGTARHRQCAIPVVNWIPSSQRRCSQAGGRRIPTDACTGARRGRSRRRIFRGFPPPAPTLRLKGTES